MGVHILDGYSICSKTTFTTFTTNSSSLNRTHHSNSCSYRLWRQIVLELCPHDATIAMGTHDSSPDDAVFARLLVTTLFRLAVCAINVRDPLPQVKRSVLLVCHPFQLQERSVCSLVAKTPLVAHKNSLCI